MSASTFDRDSVSVRHKVTVRTLQAKRDRGERITMLTAYDYPTARMVEQAGTDAILVGDSLAMVVLGHDDTLSVTMDEMIHHCRAVRRGARAALLVGDMPFMSYQVTVETAVRNAGRFLSEGGMDAVKLEGGRHMAETIRAIVRAGIPVQGHIGLTPQSVNALGGFRVQGRTAETARDLVDDALALQEAGCFSIVLESVPARLGKYITDQLDIPTIGIGAGVDVDGQVLVLHDLVGIFQDFKPKFVRRYANVDGVIREAVEEYNNDVSTSAFPGPENTYTMPDDEWAEFCELAGVSPDASDEGSAAAKNGESPGKASAVSKTSRQS